MKNSKLKIGSQNPELRSQNFSQSRLTPSATRLAMIIFLTAVTGLTALPAKGATVLISLQTCGISPAANRNLVLTPLQAAGSGAIPVMDKIQTNTDQNGNAQVTLMPGVYQTDVRPAWGQVGVTEFYFYVDPSNAVQSAFTNLLTGTNNTYPPNQYAYSAQASDARYALLPVTSNDVASINPAQIYPPIPNGITNNQTGVTLGGNFNGTFGGNGGGLTNVNAAGLGGVGGLGYVQDLSQGLGLWLNAKQMLLSSNWLYDGVVVQPQDLTGHWTVIQNANGANNITFSMGGLDGTPSFYFNGSELEISNYWLGLNTNSFTLVITFRDLNGTNNEVNYIMQAGGWGQNFPYAFRLSTWVDQPLGGAGSGGAMGYYPFISDGLLPSRGVYQAQFLTHVFTLSFDGTNEWTTLDGKPTSDTRLQQSSSVAGLLLSATNLYIGGQITGGVNFLGYISDLRIYTNACSGPFQYSLESYLCRDAGLPINSLNLVGDSIQEGLKPTVCLGTLQGILTPLFPNWLFNTEAYSGRTSLEEYTNLLQWLQQKPSGQNVCDIYVGINDFSGETGSQQETQVASTLAAYTNMIAALRSNNIPVILSTIMSVYWETNSIKAIGYDWRSNLNATIRSMTNLGAYVCDYAGQIPSMGTNNAFLNTNSGPFNLDEIHPDSLGYTNMSNILLPILQTAISTAQGIGYANSSTIGTLTVGGGGMIVTNGGSVTITGSGQLTQNFVEEDIPIATRNGGGNIVVGNYFDMGNGGLLDVLTPGSNERWAIPNTVRFAQVATNGWTNLTMTAEIWVTNNISTTQSAFFTLDLITNNAGGGGLYAVNSPPTGYSWAGTNATAVSWTVAVPMAILSNTFSGEVDIFRNSGNPLASNICVTAIWIQN